MPTITYNNEVLDTDPRRTLLSKLQDVCDDLSKESVAKQVAVGGASGW